MIAKGFKFSKNGLPAIKEGSIIAESWVDLFSIKKPLRADDYGSLTLAETLDGQTKVIIRFINILKL